MRPKREQFVNSKSPYFISTQTQGRKPFFRHDRWAQLMQSTIHHYNGTGYTLHAYVIMPDHLHILMTPIESIEKAMQLIKGGFSFRAKREFNWQEEIWQPGFTDHRIRDAVDWQRHIDYIRTNPIEAKLTSETDLYVFMNLLQKEVPHELKTGAIH